MKDPKPSLEENEQKTILSEFYSIPIVQICSAIVSVLSFISFLNSVKILELYGIIESLVKIYGNIVSKNLYPIFNPIRNYFTIEELHIAIIMMFATSPFSVAQARFRYENKTGPHPFISATLAGITLAFVFVFLPCIIIPEPFGGIVAILFTIFWSWSLVFTEPDPEKWAKQKFKNPKKPSFYQKRDYVEHRKIKVQGMFNFFLLIVVISINYLYAINL